MALPLQTIPEDDFSRGIDARSAENQIDPGFCRDLLNAEIVGKRVRKRKGWQGYAGNLPARVNSMQYISASTEICFTLDDSIDLSAVDSSPIVVYGRTESSSANGPFTNTDVCKYYGAFTVDVTDAMSAGSGTITIPATTHNISSTSLYANVVESTSTTNRSHRSVGVTGISTNESTYALTADYVNGTGSAINTYVYYVSRPSTSGSVYLATLSHTGSGSETFNIAAATHSLSNYNIIAKVQVDNGATREFCTPDSITVDSSTGQVSITLTAIAATTFYAILSTTTTSTAVSGTALASTTTAFTISDITSPWIFPVVYSNSGTTLTEIQPDSITYDDATQDVTISIVNSTSSNLSIYIYYLLGSIRSNVLCVTDATVTGNETISDVQMTLWGLDHSELYGTATHTQREGWVTHIDSYRTSSEERVVAGLGGNLFSARTYSESGSAYKYAQLYPDLQARTSAEKVLSPTFHVTGATPARSRGYVTGGNVSSNAALVTSATYDSGTGWTKYVLSLTSMAILDSAGVATTIGNVISTTTDLEDYLTLTQMSHSKLQGTYKIKQVTSGSNVVNIWVDNSNITNTAYDDTGLGGRAAITTDRLTWTANSPFLASDALYSSGFTSNSLTVTVKSSSTTSTVISGITTTLTIPGGVVIPGSRSSRVVPMRLALPTATSSVVNLVRGDMISYTGIDRKLRVKSINYDSDRTVSIAATGGVATVTLGSGTTSHLLIGGRILLLFAGTYTGVQTITDIPSSTTFTFSTTSTDSASSCTLVGATAEVDESLSFRDSDSDAYTFQVAARWIPYEVPDDSYGLTGNAYKYHFSATAYENQSFLRSSMVTDSMFFSNGSDPVYKLDGTNIYRAGLPEWQPGLFIAQDTSGTAKIICDNPTATVSAVSGNVFTVTAGNEAKFPVGSKVRMGTTDYLVLNTWADAAGTNGYIRVQRPSTTALSTGTITLLSTFRYYYRLNAIDANDNIVASAVTGHQDTVVSLGADAAIKHRLVGFPAWDAYDYDRLEVEIYRTHANEVAPFYKVTTIQMDFDNTQGYVDYTDTYSDDNLIDLDVTSILKQNNELGTAWSEPLRASYVTAIANRLVLANVKDYPKLDMQIVASADITAATFANKTFTFRIDDTASGTTTDMVSTVVYEGINGTTDNTTAYTIGSNQFTVTCTGSTAVAGDWVYLTYSTANTVTDTFVDGNVNTGTDTITLGADHGFINGDTVLLTNSGGALPAGLATSTTYYVVGRTATTIQLSATSGGAAVDITAAAGGGTHTVTKYVDLTYSGWWQIYSVSGTDLTIKLTGATTATAYPNKYVVATDPTNIPILLGTDGNLGMVNGDSLDLFDFTRRMALAINSSMRMCDTSVTGMTTFQPWLMARSGNDVGKAGRIIISQPRTVATTAELVLPSSFTGSSKTFTVFVNNLRRATSASISMSTAVYNSRILMSYENYPEIFDQPTAIVDSESDSAIDVNSADGQEITGAIPFFGEAAFGASQQSGILVVFKTNSIYLVDINEKVAGRNPVQKIETEGLGCTAPYSIAPTKRGIMFANESGMYCLRRDLSIQYLGKFMERKWGGTVNLDQLTIMQGHHFGTGRVYKLSVPLTDATSNTDVYKYDHTLEAEGQVGAWSRDDNYPATGWANLAPYSYFGTSTGRVGVNRNTNTSSDYRDDSSAIEFRLDTRATDFGNPGIRKLIRAIVANYRVPASSTGTTVKTATDLNSTYTSTTNPTITYGTQDIVTLVHTTANERGTYFQTRISNSTLDEGLEVAGLSYKVGGLTSQGMKEAADS